MSSLMSWKRGKQHVNGIYDEGNREQCTGLGKITGAIPPELGRAGLYLLWAFSLVSRCPGFVSKMQKLGAEFGQTGQWLEYL